MNTTENNKLIAKFMEYDRGVSDLMGYDTSWDWLMPVVEKIESLGYFCMINKWTSVYTGTDGDRISVTTVEGKSKIRNTHQAVIEFIKWYNEQLENDWDMACDMDREPDMSENIERWYNENKKS